MIAIDFEYNKVTHPNVNLVCCTTYNDETDETFEWWLHNNLEQQQKLKTYLERNILNTFFAWAVTAEARSFLALGLNPVEFKFVDGFLEYRCLTNHNDALQYGKQLVDGKVKETKRPPPKWKRSEEDKAEGFKPKHNLAEATYKLCSVIRDTEHKDKMRDLIISDPDSFTPEEQKAIQDYCTEDVKFLPELYEKIYVEYENLLGRRNLDPELLLKEQLLRGKYSSLTAKMESRGYPIDYEKTKNFSSSVGPLLEECQREINSLFPDIKPFKYKRVDRRFSMDTKAIKKWLTENVDTKLWMKTSGGKKKIKDLSLSLDAWTHVFDFKHSYPKDNFGAQMVRYFKLKQNMNGFVPAINKEGKKTKRDFWDAVGPDQRVRPYFNIYGSQSSRSQPGSTSFLFLKPAWMRSLCAPSKGRAIGSIDYGSEEFYISALVSKDKNMISSYLSGDIYLAFSKLAGAVPEDGTREQYGKERNIFKQVVLSISYMQTAMGLSKKLTEETGEEFTETQGQELINKFYEAYSVFGEWQTEIQNTYKRERHLKLLCGWYLWGDNPNFRSSTNFVSQGFGAAIMRKAVEFAEELGLEVIVTLHDALYIEFDSSDYSAMDKLADAMRRAFEFYFTGEMKDFASKIKMDPFIWGPDFETDSTVTTPGGLVIDCSDIYVDSRSISEFEQFKGYFENRIEDEWL